jgi:hypothetical protein
MWRLVVKEKCSLGRSTHVLWWGRKTENVIDAVEHPFAALFCYQNPKTRTEDSKTIAPVDPI